MSEPQPPRSMRVSDRSEARRDAVVAIYDAFSEDLALLGDQMSMVGADQLAHECREFAYVAWRAARGEHLNPKAAPPSFCACVGCRAYRLIGDHEAPAMERLS